MNSPQPGPAHSPDAEGDPGIVSNGRDPEQPLPEMVSWESIDEPFAESVV